MLWKAIRIVSFLSQNFDPNRHLPEEQRSLCLSYIHQIRSTLYPYYILTLFDNEANFVVMRKLYGKRITFPFSLFYPGRMEKFAKQYKENVFGLVLNEKDENDTHQKAAIDARIFLNTLSKKLGNQRYFFGDKPSELDAHMYAHLAVLYHILLPENPIQSHIGLCPNLVAYVKRITREYFAEEAFDSKTVYDFAAYVKGVSSEEAEAQSARKERIFQILAGFFAAGLMAAYVSTSGILESGIFKRRLENIGYDDDDDDEDDDI